ncbi:hypothetical protein FSP39_019582 [Pinctada imbricata]|uniref:Sorting nexin-29 n=1 Tax=Pinctada imbricata TaxID=66713 RepID=A0AA88Y8G2_PINIB|nr:hypothetical protein FSP39_019582 [Pinctada imbricata]
MLGVIKRNFKHLDKDSFLHLYKSLVRPHLEYASCAWYTLYKKDAIAIENTQRRATKLIYGIQHLSYLERLLNLGLPSLEYRRIRADVIQVYKYINNLDEMSKPLFVKSQENRTRGDDSHSTERQSILTRLLDAVKQCQVRFGGRTELAADADSRVSCLCAAWEVALQHGIKHNSKAILALKQMTELTGLTKVTDIFSDKESEPVFWNYVKEHLTKHEQDRFYTLKQISTDMGRGRSWLRACLNEHSLERYMHMLIERDDLLSLHYETWAFLRDQEKNSMLPMMSAGLGSILFAINIDNPDLNAVCKTTTTTINIPHASKPLVGRMEEEPRPVIAGEESPPLVIDSKKKEKKKKKKTTNIVSFDENDSGTYTADIDYPDFGSKYKSDESHSQQAKTDKDSGIEGSETNDVVPQINLEGDSFGATSNGNYQRSISYRREPSLQSNGSQDRPPSVSSLSSADLDNSSDLNSFYSDTVGLVPLTPLGQPISPVIRAASGSEVYGSSVDSSEGPGYTGMEVETAALALDMVQRGTNFSYRTAGDGVNMEEVIKKDVMSTEELKQAVVAMMVRKDEVEEQNRNIQGMLQQEMETSSLLRAEIEDMKQTSSARQEKDLTKYQALQKENELLKHQLRRYVNAVQMLRAEGSQIDGNLGIHLEDPQPSIPPAKSNIDYSHEASEYEKKLIQVAEMHGELMEFNEMLHRQINSKDALIKRLQSELVSLRGPLPQDLQLATEDMGADSDSNPLQARTLVNVWIPAAFLQGASSDVHHVYQVYIRIKDEEWNIYKRYSQFHQLHVKLKKVYPKITKFEFPPKKTIGKKDARVVENRRCLFQSYLRHVINFMVDNDKTLSTKINKESFIQLLPFFSDKKLPEKDQKKKMNKVSSTASLSNNQAVDRLDPQQEYDGL